jgi:AcrR family transcriptional regulator
MTVPRRADLRSTPQQARSRETVEHILATAADLLTEVGIDQFNTNLLADRADVRVRTVYRYFPNKLAILRELARRLVEAWDTWFDGAALADPRTSLREVWSKYVSDFVSGVASFPGGLAIRAALHSLPELREIEADDTRRLAARLSHALCARSATLEPRRARLASAMLLETAVATLDAAFTGPRNRRRSLLAELVEMQVAYLERMLAEAAS